MGKEQEAPKELQWQALLEKALTEPGMISRAFSQFHSYSVGNQMLALVQCGMRGIAPGPIATYGKWKELGRHVVKGSKAIMLCMPVTVKGRKPVRDENGEEHDEDFAFTKFVFRNNWFVLAQTDGAEYKPEPIPGWQKSKALEALKIEEKPFESFSGNTLGYARQREVTVSPLADMPERTLLHEIAHVVLGHTEENPMNDDGRTPKNLREIEAESVALICCEVLGLPGAEYSRGYIQNWANGAKSIPEKSAQKIFKAADSILKAGRI